MAETPVPEGTAAPGEPVAEELEEEAEPEGPDLSSLGPDDLALLETMLGALEPYEPQPGTLSDLPQVTVDRRHIADVCRTMRDDDRFSAKMLLCLAAVDYQETLQVVYFLQSLEPERTMVLKTDAPHDDPVVPSVTGCLARSGLVRTRGPRPVWDLVRGPPGPLSTAALR